MNPARGYIANDNNDPIGLPVDNDPLNQFRPGGGIYYINSGYSDGYRMGRIDRTLQSWMDSDVPVTMDQMRSLQGNAQALDAELILPMLMPAFDGLALPPEHPMAQALYFQAGITAIPPASRKAMLPVMTPCWPLSRMKLKSATARQPRSSRSGAQC